MCLLTGTGAVRDRRWRIGLLLPLLMVVSACATAPSAGPDVPPEAVFYPEPPAPPRIQFLTSFNDSTAFRPVQDRLQRFVLGKDAREVHHIVKPYGVAMHDGTIFVCDTILGVVHAFDTVGETYTRVGTGGAGKVRKPVNITIAPDGTRYVADVERGQVVVFDAGNRYLRAIGNPEECRPSDCVVLDDEVFLVDVRDHEVERRDALSGRLLGTFGGAGTGLGEFFKPTNIDADGEGRLYVTDTINGRVQIFDRTGQVLDSFGSLGDLPGQFARPKGIAVDPEGLIYVVDAAFANVQIFDRESRLLLFFGGQGGAAGKMWLPAGITLSTEGLEHFRQYVDPSFEAEYLIIVANQYGPRRVSIFAKGHARSTEE